MSKKVKIIIGTILSLFLIGIGVFVFFKGGTNITITGNSIDITTPASNKDSSPPKIEPSERSPFSALPSENPQDRAFGIVLHQSSETMPLSGPSEADIVVEAPTDGPHGVARLIAIFQSNSPQEVGSIRSVRPFMADIAKGFDVIFSSWGGCDEGIERIRQLELDWLDARKDPANAFFRKSNIPSPHNGFARFNKLEEAAKELGLRTDNYFEGYKFKVSLTGNTDNTSSGNTDGNSININYYSSPVKWVYDSEKREYGRYWNGSKMIDNNNSEQVTASNVVVMKTSIGVLSPGVANVKVTGKGEATIYKQGEEINGKWKKESPRAPLKFFDKKGNEIRFTPGPIWIEIIE